eukprot:COSAG01_NODE_7379_length_3230_cov_2.198978_2_plen_112_part_00
MAAEGLTAGGTATRTPGCARALVLYVLGHPEAQARGVGARGREPVADRQGWVKVPLRTGDSLQKLCLKYHLRASSMPDRNILRWLRIAGVCVAFSWRQACSVLTTTCSIWH